MHVLMCMSLHERGIFVMAKNDKVKENEKQNSKNFRSELTRAQEVFINELIKGKSQRQAFLKAYPSKASNQWNSIDSAASTLLKQEKVTKRYNELRKQIRAKEQAETQWTREQAIKTLRGIIDKNQEEYDRIQAVIEEEIETLLEKIKANPKKAVKLTEELIRKRKSRIVTATHNAGIISAVSELNKMQGFNEETINLNGSVVFSGEDQLED